MTVTLVLDLVVAGLLIATIVFCLSLNRRLTVLRSAQGELRGLIEEFNRATEQARTGVGELKMAGEQAGRALQEQVERARGLRDELAFINDTGSRLADRLVERVEAVRRDGPAATTAAAPPPAAAGGRSEAERELLQALRRVK